MGPREKADSLCGCNLLWSANRVLLFLDPGGGELPYKKGKDARRLA